MKIYCFSILAAMIVFTFLLYTELCIFRGICIYIYDLSNIHYILKFISPTFISIERSIFDIISKVVRILFKNISYPLKINFF